MNHEHFEMMKKNTAVESAISLGNTLGSFPNLLRYSRINFKWSSS